MRFRDIFVITFALIILYVLVAKSELYVQIFKKLQEWITKGFYVLTTGDLNGNDK